MRIWIEVNGQEVEITEDMVDGFSLKTPCGAREVPCDCATPCGYVHRGLTGKAQLDLHLDLNAYPRWR
jgi:hypothetical protein